MDNLISYTASEPVTYFLNMNEDIVVLDPGAQLSINVLYKAEVLQAI